TNYGYDYSDDNNNDFTAIFDYDNDYVLIFDDNNDYVLIFEGTFHILVKSPLEDDRAFYRLLSKYNVLCLPRSVSFTPGYFSLSLTANEDMIEQSRHGFQQAYQEAMNSLNIEHHL
ncbi:unnamed protein product, partial [Rotaria sordida]